MKKYFFFILPGVLIFCFYQCLFPYHLFIKEQIRLFVFSSDYLLSYFNKPAAISAMLGDFFTQFYYLRGGGPLVLAVFFYFIWYLSYQVLRSYTSNIRGLVYVALLPALAESILHYQLSYTLTNTFSLIITLTLYLIVIKTIHYRLHLLYVVFLLVGAYFASGSLVIGLSVLVYLIHKREGFYGFLLVSLGISILLPWITRSYYLLTTDEIYLYPYLRISHFSSMALLLFLSIVVVSFQKQQRLKKIVWLISVFAIPLIVLFNKPNFTREKVLSLSSEAYFGNWDRVLKKAEKFRLKNPMATYFTNIALSKCNALPDRLLTFYQPFSTGLFLEVGPESGWLQIFLSNEAFYHIGDMNMTQHSAHLGMIFSPYNRSSRMVKRLAEVNMVIGENEAALKYLNLLEKTLFHKKWAHKRIKMMHNPDLMRSELLMHKAFLPTEDILRKGGDYLSGLKLLVRSHPENTRALNYLLCYHLLNKDLQSFKNDFDSYYRDALNAIPRVYSEALMVILAQQKASSEIVRNYNISPLFVNQFVDYTNVFSESNGDMNALSKKYNETYWFYYHFAKMNKK